MENTITISIEEYKDLVRVAVEKEFHEQIIGLQEQIKKMEETHLEDCQNLRENSMYWFKRWETENEKANALQEELDFYKPSQQEQKEAS